MDQNQLPKGIIDIFLFSVIVITGIWMFTTGLKAPAVELPSEGVVLPVRWGDLGVKMISAGVIDEEKFGQLYTMGNLLYGKSNSNLKITPENSGMILNLLWALGLGVKNDILETGPITTYGVARVGNFASTGGWTLAKGDPMGHYSHHAFFLLTPEQQKLVERASKNIYRPCCNNPTHLPDCNHGMAMLGLLELMASQGVSEKEMYKAALQVNTYWFPDAYSTIAQYFALKGADSNEVDPKEILGESYSSGSGYQQILSQVTAPAPKSGGGCEV